MAADFLPAPFGGDSGKPSTLADIYAALGVGDDEHVSICHRTNGVWHTRIVTPADAGNVVDGLAGDVYFGLNPVDLPIGTNGHRGSENNVTRVVGLPADLDVKNGACPDLDTAHAIIDDVATVLGTRPVVVISSGRGLQPIWRVTDCDATQGRSLLGRFGRLVAACALKRVVNVDKVFDLARVLRAPGTLNHKYNPPVPTSATLDGGSALTAAEITERLVGAGVREEPDDADMAGQALSDPNTWPYAGKECPYAKKMIKGLATDNPSNGRHPMMMSNLVRLACLWRNGCLPDEPALRRTIDTIARRHKQLCKSTWPQRAVGAYEIESGWSWAVDHVSHKTDERVAEELGNHSHDDNGDGGHDDSVATQLVNMGRNLYSLGVSTDGIPYGTAPDAPHVAIPLRGGKPSLRAELARIFFEQNGFAASTSAVSDACLTLEGFAMQENPRRCYLRVAEHGGAVYIDTADAGNRVIKVADGAWEYLENNVPVIFRRTEATAAMPEAHRCGDWERLWEFVNIAPADRAILLAHMVSALVQVDVPHGILGLLAEHGSAKSSTAKFIVSLIDPSPAELRSPPRTEEQWIVAANGSWVVALDNLSHIPEWLSNAICRAATGDGDVKRQLYTDASLVVIKFRRVVLLNGIDLGGLRSDFTDRLVAVKVARITDDDRRAESELYAAWERQRAVILGGLLDLAAKVHQRLPHITPPKLPRMADFALVLIAVDEILETNGFAAYREHAKNLMADSVLADPFVSHLRQMGKAFIGETAGDILKTVTDDCVSKSCAQPPAGWPRNARPVTTRLRNHAPGLRMLGWIVEDDDGQNKACVLKWTLIPPSGETPGGLAAAGPV